MLSKKEVIFPFTVVSQEHLKDVQSWGLLLLSKKEVIFRLTVVSQAYLKDFQSWSLLLVSEKEVTFPFTVVSQEYLKDFHYCSNAKNNKYCRCLQTCFTYPLSSLSNITPLPWVAIIRKEVLFVAVICYDKHLETGRREWIKLFKMDMMF